MARRIASDRNFSKPPWYRRRWFYWVVCWVTVLLVLLSLPIVFPGWLLSNTTLDFVQGLLRSSGVELQLEWRDRSVRWRSFGKLQFDLDFKKICVRPQRSSFCFYDGKGTVVLGLGPLIQIEEIGPLRIARADLDVRSESTEKKEKSEESGISPLMLPAWLQPQHIDVQLKKAQLSVHAEKKKLLHGELSLGCAPLTGPKEVRCELPAQFTLAPNGLPFKSVEAILVVENLAEHWKFTLKGEARGGETFQNLNVDMKGTKPKEKSLELAGTLGGKLNDAPWRLQVTGNLSDDGQDLNLQTQGAFSPVALGRSYRRHIQKDIQLEKCELSASFKELSHIQVRGCVVGVPLATRFGGKPRLEADGEVELPAMKGKLAIRLPHQAERMYSVSGFLSASFEKKGEDIHLQVDPNSKLGLHFSHFQDVVELLSRTPLAVPAPLNSMSGKVDVELSAEPSGSTALALPFTVKTDLASPQQALKLSGEGTFAMDWKEEFRSRLETQILIEEGKIQTPPLNLTSVPEVLPDPRIGESGAEGSETVEAPTPSNFTYLLRIRTADSRRLYVSSNLLTNPLPFSMDLKVNSEAPLRGSVTLHPVKVTLFRRDANVRRLRLRWLPTGDEENVIELRGKVDITYPDYEVNVDLAGTLDRPRITLVSSPPLTRQEIIALLLYGNEELGSEEENSVAGFDAAVTQRSLGLASLYFLARTPIQSLSYDPSTKSVTAKVRLGTDTTVNLTGGSEGNEKVGFSRRIGKNWAFTTEIPLGDNTSSGPLGVSGFLEWFNRY